MTKPLLFVGTYTRNTESEGIYVFDEDLNLISVNRNIENPSFLVFSPDRKILYSVNETNNFKARDFKTQDFKTQDIEGESFEEDSSGAVSAFEVGASGELRLINQLSSRGADPCHLAMAASGKFLLVSNYSGASLVSFSILKDGSLGECMSKVQHSGRSLDKNRQQSAHVHSATLLKNDVCCYVADLGMDQVLTYSVDANGNFLLGDVKKESVTPGAGPRHLVFDSADKKGYLINELNNTITIFQRDKASNKISECHSMTTLPIGYKGKSYCADIHLSRDGKFLYGSNRGHDSIAVFSVEGKDEPELIEIVSSGGSHPRNFAISPDQSQLYVANRDSDNIVVFDRNPETGMLQETGTVLQVPSPVFLQFY